jgi:hypothetical protein
MCPLIPGLVIYISIHTLHTKQSFENITSIEHSLQLLRRFQARQAATAFIIFI